MISSSHVYYSVNVILVAVGIAVIVMIAKSGRGMQSKKAFLAALVLLVLSAGILAFCFRIWKMGALAYVGQMVGVADGVYDKVKIFRYYGLVGTILEVVSVALLAVVTGKLLAPRPQEAAGEEEQQ